MGFTHHKAQCKDEPKHTEITRCRRGKFLCLLPKIGRNFLPTCIVSLLLEKRDIHGYEVPSKYIGNFLECFIYWDFSRILVSSIE